MELDRFSLQGRPSDRPAELGRALAGRVQGEGGPRGRAGRRGGRRLAELSGPLARRAAERGFSMALGHCSTPGTQGPWWSAATRAAPRVPAPGALGRRRSEPGRDAPRPGRPHAQRFPGRRGGHAAPALGVRRLSLNFSFLRAILAAGGDVGAAAGWPGGCCGGCPAGSRSSPCTGSTRSSPRPGSPATWPCRQPKTWQRFAWRACEPKGC